MIAPLGFRSLIGYPGPVAGDPKTGGGPAMAANAKPVPGKTLISPTDHTLIMIDHQSQMAFATKSIDAVTLRNNAAMVAEAAAGFKVSTILTTVAEKTFSGPIFDEIKDAFPGAA